MKKSNYKILMIILLILAISCTGCTTIKLPQSKTYTNSIGMEFTEIPAGQFTMHKEYQKIGRVPLTFDVAFENSFYMGTCEVTQAQWNTLMDDNPSRNPGNNLPVENINWYKANEFVKKLNELESTNKYRLPSEAEWEYAAKAGVDATFFFGEDESLLPEYAWYKDNSGASTHQTGTKDPNPWGLYDMYGNVREWTADTWTYDTELIPRNGTPFQTTSRFNEEHGVIKGSSYSTWAFECNPGRRDKSDRSGRNKDVGFRIAMDK
jgi:formylglycine-generating enzyme required for sulfatase activity